jgi:hypothetical protein
VLLMIVIAAEWSAAASRVASSFRLAGTVKIVPVTHAQTRAPFLYRVLQTSAAVIPLLSMAIKFGDAEDVGKLLIERLVPPLQPHFDVHERSLGYRDSQGSSDVPRIAEHLIKGTICFDHNVCNYLVQVEYFEVIFEFFSIGCGIICAGADRLINRVFAAKRHVHLS